MIRMVTEFLKNYGQKFHFWAFCIPNMTSSSQNILKRIRVGKAFLALSQIVNDFFSQFNNSRITHYFLYKKPVYKKLDPTSQKYDRNIRNF